jgi:hypothetical protein
MKKIILPFFCFSLLIYVSLNTYSQSYIPLLQSGNQWNVLRDGANPIHYTEIFKVDIDTTINGKLCKKIVSTSDSSNTATYHFSCYMYEDTAIKKIYNFDSQFNQKFYFDFNVQVGDSLFISTPEYGFESCDTFIVAEISYIAVGGIDRKRITLSYFSDTTEYTNADIWIEGIGSYHGLTYGAVSPRYIGSQYNLLCFSNNNQLVYENSIFNYCYSSNVGIKENENSSVLVYPNPTTSQLNISFNSNYSGAVSITNLFGQKVLEEIISDKTSHQIDVSGLANGLYVISLKSKSGVMHSSFIKE